MSESTSNLTKPQLAMALGAAATVILAGGLYWRMKGSNQNKPVEVPVAETPRPTKVEPLVPDVNDEKYKKAQQLKEEGNNFFKERKYDLAIKAYSDALALTDVDSHLLFSNRSAAFTSMNALTEAMNDAKKCIELKPDWSKGYFRLGKALQQNDEVSEAFINFYKGLLLEPKSEELRKMVEQTRVKLPPFGERAFKFQFQAKLLTYYLLEVVDQLCSEVGLTRTQVENILSEAINSKNLDKIHDKNEELKAAYQKDQLATLEIIVILLLVGFEKPALAHSFVEELLLIDRENAQVLILSALTKIRMTNNIFGRMEDATSILDLIREALLRRPDDIFITNTYMGFIATLVQLIGSPDSPLDVPTVLKELKIVLSHPKGDKLQIAHTGVQIWFKFFEDPSLQHKLMIEEREAESQGLNPSQAYLKGLLQGAFRPIVMDPFFLQAMSDVLLPFPQLEKILGPFRSAILSHLNVDSPTDFESLVQFIHAMSLQLFRCNYLWDIKEEDKEGIDMVKKMIEKQLKDVDSVCPQGILPRKLYQQLSIFAMFHSLNSIANIEELVLQLDLSKLPASFVTLLNKSVLADIEERDIRDSIIALTPIPDTDLVQYFNQHVSPTWDSPPLSVLTPVSVQTELKLRYPYYIPNLPSGEDTKIRVLIAACGSGREIYQVYTTYKNVEITAIDVSEVNLAYAIRQNKELGVEGVKYYLADILNLNPSHFPANFDIVIANDFLHYCTDPVKAWDKLSALVKPGGLFMATLHNKKLVNAITKMRSMLVSAFKPPLFDNSANPKLLRIATDEEVREARRLVLDSLDQTREVPAELMDLVTSLGFYSLNEFRDLIFHPVVTGFTYTTVNKLVNQLGLKLVGFDFPEIYYEKELSYKGEYYTDRAMLHGPSLDAFDAKDNSAFAGFYISFTCEKPL